MQYVRSMNSRPEAAARGRGLPGLRARNRGRLLDVLAQGMALSQTELSERTGLSAATVSNLIAELRDDGEIEIAHGVRNGRRANLISRRVDSRALSIGLSVSRDALVGVSLRADGSIARTLTGARDESREYTADLALLAGLVDRLGEDGVVESVGLALGMTVDSTRGAPALTPLPGDAAIVPGFPGSWIRADVGADLAARLGVPVPVLNDGDAGALAETRLGAARGESDVLYVQLAPGVGGGLVINDQLYRGGRGGFAGEVGHLTSDPDGPLCICGNRGCLEPLFDGALLETARPVLGSDLTHARLAELAAQGDPAASRLLRETSVKLIAGLINPISFVVPAKVVLGGILAAAGEALLGPVADAAKSTAMAHFWRGEFVLGQFGIEAPAVGAALFATEAGRY